MTRELIALTALEMIEAFRKKEISPVEIMQATLEQADTVNPVINALFAKKPDLALVAARESEQRWALGNPVGVIDGLPLTIKDSIRLKGFPLWHGCRANMDKPHETEDAPPAARIKESGAIIFAKTAMPDIGMLACGVSSAHGIVRNPWNTDFSPGGSSAGAAAAVAAGIGPCALGTDGGGSVRLPASQCGLFGFKPTNGRIPHTPPDPVRSAGPLTRSVADAALLMNVLVQPDTRDYGSLPPLHLDFMRNLDRDPKGLRLGLLLDMGFPPTADGETVKAITTAAGLFENAGAEIETISLSFDFDPIAAVETYFRVRSFLEYNAFSKQQKTGILPYLSQWIESAADVSGIQLMQAMSEIERIRKTIRDSFEPYDYILSPVMPTPGFPAEALGVDVERPTAHIGYAGLYNQTGQPAASICCGFSENGLPVGLQIVGKRFDDLGVLQMSNIYEQLRGFGIVWPMTAADRPSAEKATDVV